LKAQKEKVKSLKVINMDFSEFVFLNRKGEPTKNSAYDITLFKLCDKAGIPRFSMHVLRHTMLQGVLKRICVLKPCK
jgi:integrase